LHFGLTVEQLRTEHQSKPWNPLIAGAFYRRGLIESWGRGTLRIANLMQEAGLPKAEFLETRLAFTVRFPGEIRVRPTPGKRRFSTLQSSILEILSESGEMTLREIHERIAEHYEREQVRQGLRALRRAGVVEQRGATNRSTWSLSGGVDIQ
jgi:ATP-dependent DNA helicase RecG